MQSLLGVIFDLVGIIFFLTDCSNFLILFTQGYGEVSISKHLVLFTQFLCTQYTELAGNESELYFCFLPSCLARLFSHFCCSGFKGENPLASCVSEHSIFQNCNAEIPCLRTLFRPLWGEIFLGIDNKLICLYN